jgi:enoyl-CoA hydratase/3-hydroxyacyl-CoA dehydrogenase
MRADSEGLGAVLERMENARERYGERFTPPTILRRLVAQGRLGQQSGQGFYAYPRPDAEQPAEVFKIETREHGVAIAWLASGQMNAIAPQVVDDLQAVWAHVRAREGIRALVIASANPFLFSAGADIKAFTTMDEAGGWELIDRAHRLFREMESAGPVTVAAVNGLAFGGGCELAMACDFRVAARSATFGQPEIKLGIIPGFGGTQRLPRLIGPGRALEMNLIGDPVLADEALEMGLVQRVVDDHELLDTALAWARRLGGQAPIAARKIRSISAAGDLDAGIEAEKRAFAEAFSSEDAREGIAAFLAKRQPRFRGV